MLDILRRTVGAGPHFFRLISDNLRSITNGYAFTRCAEGFRVLNLNRPDRAVVFSSDGKVLETSMDDIEVRIARDYLEKNRKFMED